MDQINEHSDSVLSSCNPKFFAVRHIHYPVTLSADAVVASSDHCCTEAVLSPCDHYCIEAVAPSGDHYGMDIVVPSSDHCCIETVPQSSDHTIYSFISAQHICSVHVMSNIVVYIYINAGLGDSY